MYLEIDGRTSVPIVAPSSLSAVIHWAEDQESFLFLNEFKRLEEKKFPIPLWLFFVVRLDLGEKSL
jgi:hypothetical protein